MSTPIKTIDLVLADDHQLFTDGLSALLNTVPEINLCGVVKTGKQLIHWYNRRQAKVALIDLNMPEIDGFEAAKYILKSYPDTRIIILSMYADKSLILKLKQLGVAGYLKKDCDFEVLITSIKKVALGEQAFFETNPEKERTFSQKDDFLNKHSLSARESEILSLIRHGFTTKTIAEKLYLSMFTVTTHRKNICQKLQINTAAGLVRFAIDNNL